MAKSLGADAPVEQVQEKTSSVNFKRVINAGVEVDLSFGTYTVKEMPGADFLCFMLDAVETVSLFLQQEGDGLQSIKRLIQDGESRAKLENFFILSMGLPKGEKYNFSISDYIVLLAACKEVYDWETIQKGFTDLGLLEMLQQTFHSFNKESNETTD
jgi:hypothetical protein